MTNRELATVLAALRLWQGQNRPDQITRALAEDAIAAGMPLGMTHNSELAIYFGDEAPLTLDEIDSLCERLNTRAPATLEPRLYRVAVKEKEPDGRTNASVWRYVVMAYSLDEAKALATARRIDWGTYRTNTREKIASVHGHAMSTLAYNADNYGTKDKADDPESVPTEEQIAIAHGVLVSYEKAHEDPEIGSRIKTKIEDEDTDDQGNARAIPIGTLGTIASQDGDLFNITWENGAWTRWTAEEINRDAEPVP